MSASATFDTTLATAQPVAAPSTPVPSSDFRLMGPANTAAGAAAAVLAITTKTLPPKAQNFESWEEELPPRFTTRSPQLAAILEIPASRTGALSSWLDPAGPGLAPALPIPKAPPAALRDSSDRAALSSSNQLQSQLLATPAPAADQAPVGPPVTAA